MAVGYSSYFVHLGDINVTLDLTFVVLVEWAYAPASLPPEYVGTLHLANKQCLYLTEKDAYTLRLALKDYTARTRSSQQSQTIPQPQQPHHASAALNNDGKIRAVAS